MSDDERLDVSLSFPAALGGDDGPGTNPEQLFGGAFAACFHNALKGVARQGRHSMVDSSVTATVALVGEIPHAVGIEVTLTVSTPHVDEAAAEQLIEAAEQRCPYSKAVRGNVPVVVVLEGGAS